MKKRWIWLTLALVLLGGCGRAEAEKAPEEPAATAAATASPTPAPTKAPEPEPTASAALDALARQLGREIDPAAEVLSLTDRSQVTAEDVRAILDALPCLPALKAVDVTGCVIRAEDAEALSAATALYCNRELYGTVVNTGDEEIDLSHCTVTDGGAALEALIPRMPNLRRVDMSYCGLSDEELDILDQRHETVRIVWTLRFGGYELRTDAKAFIVAKEYHDILNDSNAAPLYYAHDLIALDLGHMQITHANFVYGMPKLRWLILADTPLLDLTAVGSLHELMYLELFKTYVTDLTPLLTCENLTDLNLCYLYRVEVHDSAREVLPQMKQLRRLFYFGNTWTTQERNDYIALYPEDAEIVLYDYLESTGLDWRYHEHYFEMRDLLDMYYMEGGTNGEKDKK